jgi:hypothetical protein
VPLESVSRNVPRPSDSFQPKVPASLDLERWETGFFLILGEAEFAPAGVAPGTAVGLRWVRRALNEQPAHAINFETELSCL